MWYFLSVWGVGTLIFGTVIALMVAGTIYGSKQRRP